MSGVGSATGTGAQPSGTSSALLGTVRALAGGIGPRGTGTAAEASARDLVADRLAALGLPVQRQEFRAVASQNAFPLAIDALALVALAVYAVGTPLARWSAAGLALATAPLLWHTIRTSGLLLQPLLRRVASGNVLARIGPRGPLRGRVVVLAHLDTNRCRLAWQAEAVRRLEPLTWLTLGILASLGLLLLAGAFLGGPRWVWWASLLPVGSVIGMVVALVGDDRRPYSPGAHDNAGSVAVALELAAASRSGHWRPLRPGWSLPGPRRRTTQGSTPCCASTAPRCAPPTSSVSRARGAATSSTSPGRASVAAALAPARRHP
jgi:hypothetical protein